VPLQILDGCLKGIIESTPRLNPLLTPTLGRGAAALDRSWLLLIQKLLCHSWVDDGLVTAKAAKPDDAGVPVHLWDKRCSLVFPHVTPALNTLRYWLTQGATTRLLHKFHAFLPETHGENWREELRSHKLATAQGRLPAPGKHTKGDTSETSKGEGIEKRFVYDELIQDVTAGIDAISRFSDLD
jgi:hypothetical protein